MHAREPQSQVQVQRRDLKLQTNPAVTTANFKLCHHMFTGPWSVLVTSLSWLFVFLAPHIKVEESFNLHAIHDIILHRTALQNYDHFIFPGVVPRSFVGGVALSSILAPVILVDQRLNVLRNKFELQILVRLALATINSAGLLHLHRAIRTKWGSLTATAFLLITCTQFHLMFWMGRTLPNMFALYPVNVASSLIIMQGVAPEVSRKNFHLAISLLIFAGVVLRAELVLLIGPLVLQGLYMRRTTLTAVTKAGLIAGFLSLTSTVLIDSYLWKRPLWPELAGQYFNVYQGKSAEWGISPFHTYFLVHLPKLVLMGLPLAILGLIVDSKVRSVVAPYAAFMLLLSFHGHKEWRFIIYVVPVWNIAAGRGVAWLYAVPVSRVWKRISWLLLLGCFGVNILASVFFAQVSIANYPGGRALCELNEAIKSVHFTGQGNITIHIDNLAAQTGATLFLQEYALPSLGRSHPSSSQPRVIYNKTENLITERDFKGFDWVITESPNLFLTENSVSKWELWGAIDGLESVQLKPYRNLKLLRIPRIIRKPKLWILMQHRH